MSRPIVFISHFRVKPGKLDELRDLTQRITRLIEAEKPRTLLFLTYLDEDGGRISFLHAFADAESLDRHFEGSDERSAAAYELIEPDRWEFFGRPSDDAMGVMRQAAAASGATLAVHPAHVAGFLRLATG
jgi:quinol monooxygenase YgiN